MKIERSNKELLKNMALYIFIVFSISNIWGPLLAVELNLLARLLITALVGLVVHLLFSYPFFFLLSIITSIIPLLILNRYHSELVWNCILWIKQFIVNIMIYFKGTEQILIQNRTGFWGLLTFGLCILTWFVVIKIKQVVLLIPLYMPGFIYYWYIYVDEAYPMMIFFIIIYFVLLGRQGYFNAEKKWLQNKITYKHDIHSSWVRTAFIYGLIIVLLAVVMPKRSNLINWYWLESQLTSRFPVIMGFRDDLVYSRSYAQGSMFDFHQTGFQLDPTELGGPVRPSDRLVMLVKSPYSLYLRGNVKTLYENNRWERGTVVQMNYNVKQVLPREVLRGTIVELEITNVNMASSTIFTPYQPVRIVSSTSGNLTVDENFQLIQQNTTYKNEGYTVQAIIPYINPIDIEENEKIWANISEGYLQLPQGLSPKVTQLANKITRDKYSPYEKAEAIGNFLRDNYVYTLEPSVTPQGKEFIEYFLFEEKEGYCTYFATAMAILLRTQGIPSRYVEGYRMPMENNDNVYEVRQNNAHAWVEAYIEPMGWLSFEATPAFQPTTLRNLDTDINNNEDPESSFDELEQMPGNLQTNLGNNSHNIEDTKEDGVQVPLKAYQEDVLSKHAIKIVKIVPKLIYILLIGIILLRVGYIYLDIQKYYKKLKENNNNSVIPCIYQNLLDLLKEMGYPIEIGETPYEYVPRIMYKVHDYNGTLEELTEIFIGVKYGGKETTTSNIEDFLNYLILVDNKVKVQMGLWRYYYTKYFKGTLLKRYL